MQHKACRTMPIKSSAFDERPSRLDLKREFSRARLAEAGYARDLKRLARACYDIIRGFDPTDPVQLAGLKYALNGYSAAIRPWAASVADRMVKEVAARDRAAWGRVSQRMGLSIQRDLQSQPLASVMASLAQEQAALIGSIPREAAEKVAEWTQKGLAEGTRPQAIADRIMSEIGGVTRSRAVLIARTESGRVATTLTQARSLYVGADSYKWTSAGDSDVRPDHRKLDGKIFRWSEPPVADRRSGMRYHPGCGPNCRCVAVPLIQGL